MKLFSFVTTFQKLRKGKFLKLLELSFRAPNKVLLALIRRSRSQFAFAHDN